MKRNQPRSCQWFDIMRVTAAPCGIIDTNDRKARRLCFFQSDLTCPPIGDITDIVAAIEQR